MSRNIVAIATPNYTGGISVIRISGDDAISISDKVFASKSGKKLSEIKGYTALFGDVVIDGVSIDEVVAMVYRSPKSYTGENVVEISCHGGVFITKEILRHIVLQGASLAEPGEFTKTAFMNGKMTLTKAEAIVDLISAKNTQALKAAKKEMDGRLFEKISNITESLLGIAGHLSAWVDYPEDDIPVLNKDSLLESLNSYIYIFDNLIKTYDYSCVIKEGILTTIVGKTNVGKSTLMNFLVGYQKSIVSNIAGTTRDRLEETVNMGDVILRLWDTAGIRDTDDEIEKIGVGISKRSIDEATLILAVFDSSNPLSKEDIELIQAIKDKNVLVILNKVDLPVNIDRKELSQYFKFIIEISAKDGFDLTQIEKNIKQLINLDIIDTDSGIVANERQRICIINARDSLLDAIVSLKNGMTLDAITISIEMAISSILELTGKSVNEEVVNEVFSHFCVGK